MSYSTMLCVRPSGLVEPILELRNGWGSAPVVWVALVEKYERMMYPNDIPGKEYYRGFESWGDLWEKAESLDLQWWEWNALLWTYDHHIVRGQDLKCFAESMRVFQRELVKPTKVSHLIQIADKVDELLLEDPLPLGICHRHTSASDNLWSVRVLDQNGEDQDETRPYDVNRDTKHTFFECRTEPHADH